MKNDNFPLNKFLWLSYKENCFWTQKLRCSWKLRGSWIQNNTIKTFITSLVLISKAYYLNSHYVCGQRNKKFGNVKTWKMISVTFIKDFRFPNIIVNSCLIFSMDNLALLPVIAHLKSSMSFTIDNILRHSLIPW